MKLWNTALAGFALLVALPAWATDTAALIKAVEAKYKDVEVLQADFKQVSKSELYGDETQTGKLTLKRPSKMRWEFAEGGKQFVTDGKTLWIWTPEDNQVVKMDDVSQSASTADSFLQSLDKVSELFEVQSVEQGEDEQTLALKPKQEGAIKALQLTLTKELVVKRVVLTDQYDNVTDLSFDGVKLGGTVDDTSFTFKVPEGAEVITSGM